jgi:hypothetical protein
MRRGACRRDHPPARPPTGRSGHAWRGFGIRIRGQGLDPPRDEGRGGCGRLHRDCRARRGRPPERADPSIAWACDFPGVAEVARQWLILTFQEPYDPETGRSEIGVAAGSSAAGGTRFVVDVEQGVRTARHDGRHSRVEVQPWQAAVEAMAPGRGSAKEEHRRDVAIPGRVDEEVRFDRGRASREGDWGLIDLDTAATEKTLQADLVSTSKTPPRIE